MNLFGISSIFIIIVHFAMAALVLKFSKDREIRLIWAIFCFAASFWGVGGVGVSIAKSQEIAFLWWQIAFMAVIVVPVTFSHFVFTYLRLQRKKLLIFMYILAFSFVLFELLAGKVFLGGTAFLFNQFFWITPLKNLNLPFLMFYVIFYIFLLTYCFVELLKAYQGTTGVRKNELRYFIIGIFLGWLGAECNFLPGFGIYVYPYLNILIAIYPILIGYAMIRHHFLIDINLVIRKGVVYSMLAAIVTGLYLIFIIGVGEFFRDFFGYQSFILNITAVFIIAILFNPMKDIIQRLLDKRFFHGTLESLSSDREHLRQELFHKEKLAYVGQLASSIVHEIRNPLTSIKTFVDYFPKKYTESDYRNKFQTLIPNEIERIERVVNQLLDLAKPRKLNLKKVNICRLIDTTLALLENNFQLKKINISKTYEQNNIEIQGDEEQLKQVFLNLFLNALQAMGEGGLLTIGISYPRKSALDLRKSAFDFVTITIQDNGVGISEGQLKKLFEPFQTTKPDGIGLGLSITQEIIKLHGGNISAESKLGQGTKFTINFSKT